jgi:hypothetical protein
VDSDQLSIVSREDKAGNSRDTQGIARRREIGAAGFQLGSGNEHRLVPAMSIVETVAARTNVLFRQTN